MAWWRDVLTKHSHDECCANFLELLEIFNLWSKFLNFKGVNPRKEWRNPKKKLKSFNFMAWWRDVLIKNSQDERCANLLVLLENFNFWSKFLSFKGVSQRKEWRNPKKIKILNFHGMFRGLIKLTYSKWIMWKLMSVVWNFQFLVEILEF